MAKWMDITIFGLNVVITWQPKISHQIGTEFSEQQLNRIGVDLNGKVSQLRKRIARLQREIASCGPFSGVNFSFILPFVCFCFIAFYGYRTLKVYK